MAQWKQQDEDVLSYALFPQVATDFFKYREAQQTKVDPAAADKKDYIPKVQGLSLKNTGLTIKNGNKYSYQDFGEMMFTHFGVTGPMILSASAHIGAKLAKAPNGELSAYRDLKPALTREQLDANKIANLKQDQTNSSRM